MSGHYVKDIWLKPVEGKKSASSRLDLEVWMNSKGTNDDLPFEDWHCEFLTKIYHEEGLIGLALEITNMIRGGTAQLHGKKARASYSRLRPPGTY